MTSPSEAEAARPPSGAAEQPELSAPVVMTTLTQPNALPPLTPPPSPHLQDNVFCMPDHVVTHAPSPLPSTPFPSASPLPTLIEPTPDPTPDPADFNVSGNAYSGAATTIDDDSNLLVGLVDSGLARYQQQQLQLQQQLQQQPSAPVGFSPVAAPAAAAPVAAPFSAPVAAPVAAPFSAPVAAPFTAPVIAAPVAPPKGAGAGTQSAPRRGMGILKTVPIGGRVPMCTSCNAQIRSVATYPQTFSQILTLIIQLFPQNQKLDTFFSSKKLKFD